MAGTNHGLEVHICYRQRLLQCFDFCTCGAEAVENDFSAIVAMEYDDNSREV